MTDSTSKNQSGTGSNARTSKKSGSKKSASAQKQDAANLAVTDHVAVAPAADKTGKGLGLTAIALSLVALCGAGYAWYQTAVNARLSSGEQTTRLMTVEQKLGDFGSSQTGFGDAIDQIRQRVSSAETGVSEQVSQVKQLVSSTETALMGQISEVKQQIAATESQLGDQLRDFGSRSTEQQQQLEASVASSSDYLKTQADQFRSEFDTLSTSIDGVRAELGSSVETWSLREIEHLLVIANQRVQLAQDAMGARNALQIADQRIAQLNQPTLLPVREALSAEIAALSSIPEVDYAAATNSIGLLTATLQDLPLRGLMDDSAPKAVGSDGTTPAAATESSSATDRITSIGRSFLTDLSKLVQVEKDGKVVAVTLTPEIERMVLERGRLMLDAAQIALLRQQSAVYQNRLAAVEQWVGEKYQQDNDQTRSWLAQLNALKAVQPTVEYPDISQSLSALRGVIGAGE